MTTERAPRIERIFAGSGRIGTALKERWSAPQGLTLNRPNSIGGLAVNATRTCTIDGCARKSHARGMCTMHYQRWAKRGDAEDRRRPTLEDRFWEKVQPTGFCWEWTARRDENGYGMFYVGGERIMNRAHRVAYELLVGPIPDGMHLDHLCRNRACCNPDHLDAVTPEENLRRGFAPAAVTAREGVCRRGHTMADAYIRPDTGARQCQTCIRIRGAKQTAKRRGRV